MSRIEARRVLHPRLVVLERVPLAQRQSLVLVQADGRRFLIAASAEGHSAFFPLDDRPAAESSLPSSGSARW
jgi:flagellar biogenesis protein FliO